MRDRIKLAEYFNTLGFKIGAEVGVADGRYSEILCQKIPGLTLHCIDPWETYRGNRRGGGHEQQYGNYEIAKKRLSAYDTNLMRMSSMDAVRKFPYECLDFVFIDGNHDFDFIMEDLIEWSRRVKKGGIVSGHDYYNFHNSGVIEAVDIYAKAHKIDLQLTEQLHDGWRDDRAPCFWWRK